MDLTPASGDPARYLQWLGDLTARIDIRGLVVGTGKAHNFPIEDLYVPLSTAAPADKGRSEGGERRMELLEAVRHRRLVIIGDPGAGKTTFLRRIANALATARLEGSSAAVLPEVEARTAAPPVKTGPRREPAAQPFPIFIRVADLAEHIRKCSQRPDHPGPATRESPEWLIDFLRARSREHNHGLTPDFFPRLLNEGKCLVMLDGLDEAAGHDERVSIAGLFQAATRAYPDCRFIVTTRPLAYQGQATLENFDIARIEPLDESGVATFLGHWCGALFPHSADQAARHLAELQAALAATPDIRRMASNPVMLTALAVVHWNERRLPQQRADLYESILTWLARAREGKPGRVPADRCLTLLGVLALAMQMRDPERVVQLPRREAAESLQSYFEPVAEKSALDLALEFIEAEEADSGILISRGAEGRFWHLTFQEFLAARTIAGLPDNAQHQLLLQNKRMYRAEWRETALLLAGILCGKQGSGKVDGLFRSSLDAAVKEGSLLAAARAAGLLGAMVADLTPYAYTPADARYQEVLDKTYGVFEPAARGIPFQQRLEAAQAVGQVGDRRLGLEKPGNWIEIPEGEFQMGSDLYAHSKPVHPVRLRAFKIARFPVTVEDYRVFVEGKGYSELKWWTAGGFDPKRTAPNAWDDQLRFPNRPVVRVTWYEAKAFCEWGKQHIPGLRLLTEAEWEYGARGTEGRKYAWGDDPPSSELANYGGGPGHPTPVGLYPLGATPQTGILDLTGNVWEWVEDWYGDYSAGVAENPTGPPKGSERVLRGGSWYDDAENLVAFNRNGYLADYGGVSIGFRCARE
ncbi:MAG: SUMF1/EgtB/PvdO family nonheme iron enzyme [Bryobacterales bacterium]|nr:SUMF1/EgtB/PvdO family nonheme iron enzyme [Bryobacterales bacterium]